MVSLQLNLQQNTAAFDGQIIEFRRSHSAAFLELLVSNSIRGLPTALPQLQEKNQASNTSTNFSRQQLARLVDEIDAFATAHPQLGLAMVRQPRKRTVGPWQLTLAKPIALERVNAITDSAGPYPAMLQSNSLESLRLLLSDWITFEGFAAFGEHESALEAARRIVQGPLTLDSRAILTLRELYFLRRLGRFDEAFNLLSSVQNTTTPARDTRLGAHFQVALARTMYDSDPGGRWRQAQGLLAAPTILLAPCPLAASEWHNLNALCARRAAIEAFENSDVKAAITQHTIATKHFQSALYYVLSFQLWNRVHAYIDNFCYHLQKMYDHQIVPIQEVLSWYALALACADKLDSGHDDAWDLVYFGEFYLDHAADIAESNKEFTHRSSLLDDRYSPGRQEFWDSALASARVIGGRRQIAITLILYLRWGVESRAKFDPTELRAELVQLLGAEPTLKQKLCDEGYDGWLQRVLVN
jgi:tetratricopeptide (TPR) repeat protein